MMELKDRKFYEGVCEGETFEEGSAFYTRLLDTAEIIEEEGYDVLTDNNGNLLAGATGVIKRGNRYRAYIMFKQKQYHLGYFATFEEAVAARKQAEKDFFGKFLEEHKI